VTPNLGANSNPVNGFAWPTGVIVSSNTATPGPASAITYTIRVNLPDGIVEFAGVKPHGTRWPDTLNTVPAPAGTPIVVWVNGPQVTFDVNEKPDLGGCA
jgi:hypothetical protein